MTRKPRRPPCLWIGPEWITTGINSLPRSERPAIVLCPAPKTSVEQRKGQPKGLVDTAGILKDSRAAGGKCPWTSGEEIFQEEKRSNG